MRRQKKSNITIQKVNPQSASTDYGGSELCDEPILWEHQYCRFAGAQTIYFINKGYKKQTDKLDIKVSNTKDTVEHFISLVKKYDWGCLSFMVQTSAGKITSLRK